MPRKLAPKMKCHYCAELIELRRNGTLKSHMTIYPTRLCEGGNRRPGDFRARDEIKRLPISPKPVDRRPFDPGFC